MDRPKTGRIAAETGPIRPVSSALPTRRKAYSHSTFLHLPIPADPAQGQDTKSRPISRTLIPLDGRCLRGFDYRIIAPSYQLKIPTQLSHIKPSISGKTAE